MSEHRFTDFIDGWALRDRAVLFIRDQLREDPRIPLRRAGDHNAVASGLLSHRFRLFSRRHVSVADDRDVEPPLST